MVVEDFMPYHHLAASYVRDDDAVLDVGCGLGNLGALVRLKRVKAWLVGLDACRSYMEAARHFYDELILWDLRRLPLPFRDGMFDLVVCTEVIEHLPKRAGLSLLKELRRVGRRVVVSTPASFKPHGPSEENPFELHVSYYSVEELRALGYKPVAYLGGTLQPPYYRASSRLGRRATAVATSLFRALPKLRRYLGERLGRLLLEAATRARPSYVFLEAYGLQRG